MMGAAVAFAQNMTRAMRQLDRDARALHRSRRRIIRPTRPKSFRSHYDRGGLFVLDVPSTWEVTVRRGILAVSRKIGSFARVDVLPKSESVWRQLIREMVRAGAKVSQRGGAKGDRLRGQVRIGETLFDWDARRHVVGDKCVILSTGNVLDSRRGRTLEEYEDRILESIRRNFRVATKGSPLRQPKR